MSWISDLKISAIQMHCKITLLSRYYQVIIQVMNNDGKSPTLGFTGVVHKSMADVTSAIFSFLHGL